MKHLVRAEGLGTSRAAAADIAARQIRSDVQTSARRTFAVAAQPLRHSITKVTGVFMNAWSARTSAAASYLTVMVSPASILKNVAWGGGSYGEAGRV